MLKVIYKIFPFLSKNQDKIIDEKQYFQHWKKISHLTVNQISYLYNNFKLPLHQHEQNFRDLSEYESEIALMMRTQLLAAIEDNQLIAKDYDHQSEAAKKLFNDNPIISKEELFKYLTEVCNEDSVPEVLIPISPNGSIRDNKIKDLENKIKKLESKLEGWEPAISHPSKGLKAIADFVNQIYFKDGKAITEISDTPGYRDKEQFTESLLENKELKLVQMKKTKTSMSHLITIISPSKKRNPSSKK